jgi:hypothetical protein
MATWLASGSRRWRLLAAVTLVLAWLVPAHDPNWNQNAHYALVRALAEGRTDIDATVARVDSADVANGGTADVAVHDGHTYAAKAPGLALWTLPAYAVLRATGLADESGGLHRILWLLTIWAAVVPATVLVLLVAWAGDRIAPGYGTLTAVTLGVSTLVLPFATLFFAHALTAALGFGAFALLLGERQQAPRIALLAAAGVAVGYAVVVEFPSVILVAALGAYALARPRRLLRAAAYAGGVAAGVLPLLVFNAAAFGSIAHLSYAGVSGGLNREGFFGITAPSFHVLTALLFDTIGLLRLSPVLVFAPAGLVLLYRRGQRAEALVIAALAAAYLVFDSGYETPFGGASPGPRFLVPLLPFLVLPLSLVYERLPVTTFVLAAASAAQMIAITMTNPLAAVNGNWFEQLRGRFVERTAFGFDDASRRAMPLFGLLLLAAAVFAVLATPRPVLARRDVAAAALALAAWLAIAHASPGLIDAGGARLVLLYAAVAGAALVALLVPRVLIPERRPVASGGG